MLALLAQVQLKKGMGSLNVDLVFFAAAYEEDSDDEKHDSEGLLHDSEEPLQPTDRRVAANATVETELDEDPPPRLSWGAQQSKKATEKF